MRSSRTALQPHRRPLPLQVVRAVALWALAAPVWPPPPCPLAAGTVCAHEVLVAQLLLGRPCASSTPVSERCCSLLNPV